jgi:diguanylate cyclase (GGDEF)-like protein/PAS domain S-box-containing protein
MMTDRPGHKIDDDARLRAELDRRTAITPAMLHSIDEKGRLISVSDAWLAKLGYTRDEVIGRPSSEFLTPESRQYAINEVLPEFFRTGRCENVQYQMVCKDGRIIDVLLSAVLETDLPGKDRVSLAVMTDVTALKQTKRQLAESEAKYRSLVEGQSELVSLASPAGELCYVNHAYAALFGMQPDEMLGRNLFDFVPVEAHAALADHFREVCGVDHSVSSENQIILPNGKRRWIGWTNRALRDSDGQGTTIHSVGRDVEARIIAEQRVQESEARYRFLAEHSADLILLTGQDGKRYYASPASRTLLGYEPEEILEMRARDAIHPDDADKVFGVLRGGVFDMPLPFRLRHKDGRYIWVEGTARAIDIAGQPQRNLIIIRDITNRFAAEQRLRDSEARYRLLAENSTDMVFQLDRDLVRRYVSPACREVLGYEPDEMCGVRPVSMAHPDDAGHVDAALRSLLSGAEDRRSVVNRMQHRNGHWIWVEAQLRAVIDPVTGECSSIIGTVRDISERKALEDETADANRRLQVLATKDGLTGLANRRAFDDALVCEYAWARRSKKSLGLVMIDVDWFKVFNDRYGHVTGDDCLRKVGAAIAGALQRPGDLAARYGGEEFAVLLPEADERGATKVAERIRRAVAGLAIRHDGSVNSLVTVSAGVAAVTTIGPEHEAETLLQAADQALYCAKRRGRNTVVNTTSADSLVRSSSPAAA